MKVSISFNGSWETLDISPHQTVRDLKQEVQDIFLVQLPNDNHYLELSWGGAALQDNWALSDVGIASGSTIQCLIKNEQRPAMFVFIAVTGELLPIMGNASLLKMSVAGLKTVVSVQTGLPVSVFVLTTPTRVQLYDCNQLEDYDIGVGTTLRLDTWNGWVEYLQGCLLGNRLTVQSHLSQKRRVIRFQLRVALYIAASLGHLELASWLMERGVRADKPVGVHPLRHWCHPTAHRDTRKCPIHAAAESNQLLILKLFISKNISTLACRDPAGHDPLKIAIQHGHRGCVCYLVEKLFSYISLSCMTLPVRIYLQIKRWVRLGQRRVLTSQYLHSLKCNAGDLLLVDGYNQPKMSSKPKRVITQLNITDQLSFSQLPARGGPQELHSEISVKPGNFKVMQKTLKQGLKNRENTPSDEISKVGASRSKVLLPPIARKKIPRPVFVSASPSSSLLPDPCMKSSQCCVRSPREKAVYCLTIARTFTEKPWMKQLSIARALARKQVQPAS